MTDEVVQALRNAAVELRDSLNGGTPLTDLMSEPRWQQAVTYPSSGYQHAVRVQLRAGTEDVWLTRADAGWELEAPTPVPAVQSMDDGRLPPPATTSSVSGTSVGSSETTDALARRTRERAQALRSLATVVEVVGWLGFAGAAIVGIQVATSPDPQLEYLTGDETGDVIAGVTAFLYLAFGALLLLVAARVVALFADHVDLHSRDT